MPTTLEAFVVVAIALLPGAMFLWALERTIGKWELGLSDRLLRFAVFSAVFHAPFFPLTAFLLDKYLADDARLSFRAGELFAAWGFVLLYVFAPAVLGGLVGLGARRRSTWSTWFTGRDPAPQAWDNLFLLEGRTGWVRLKLKSGAWVGGVWIHDKELDLRSYAGGYPHPPDLYLAETVPVDPDDGSFLYEESGIHWRGSGLLVRWEEVEYLEFIKG